MSTYEISKSSLLSLRAEILKKEEELQKAKNDNVNKIKIIKKNTPLEFKNKGIEFRAQNDLNEEEADLLKLSRSKLEAKSKLYDKLSNRKCTSELSKRYLVRFDTKNDVRDHSLSNDEQDNYPESEEENTNDVYETSDPSEEWVEYIDCLGRTRTCLKKDLDYLKSKDENLKKVVEDKQKNVPTEEVKEDIQKEIPDNDTETIISVESELISGDYKREMLRRQWEKEEEELKNKTNIHYQNVLFEEARTHGVGYYSFSKDEEERSKQQDALKKLREETMQKQKKAQELKAMREKHLAARVRAAKNRRRERLGLPPEEEVEEESSKPDNQSPSEINVKEQEERKRKEAEDEQLKLKRKEHIRPWDIGKEGLKKEHYIYSQEEWIEKKRGERNHEFAPPSTSKKSVGNKKHNSDNENRRFSSNNIPNFTREFSNFETSDGTINTRISTGKTKSLYFTTKKDNDTDYSSTILEQTKTEIHPPYAFDHLDPSEAKRKKKNDECDIEEAVEAGLRVLRKQVEKEIREKSMEPSPW